MLLFRYSSSSIFQNIMRIFFTLSGIECACFLVTGSTFIFKVQELQEIDEKSTSESNEQVQEIFAGASLRMKVMIFKRNVYESRRRPKGILRPKNKPPLKELTTVSQ